MEKVNYRIGLDLGIASVGWAAILTDSKGEPKHIIDLGVRTFDKAEMPKDGSSLASTRRLARSTRRVIRRRQHRLDRIKVLLQSEGLIKIDDFMSRYYAPDLPDVYRLRYEALDRVLTADEFAQVMIHLAKHRGFRSNRKSEMASKETGEVLKALKQNKEIFETNHYRTIGEMIYCDDSFRTKDISAKEEFIFTPRNKAGNYKHMILRSMIEDEAHTIFSRQRELGSEFSTKELEDSFISILLSQRSFDLGPGVQANGQPSPYSVNGFGNRAGHCIFEKEEQRAPKATFTAELFVVLQKINNLRICFANGTTRPLSDEEHKKILEATFSKREVTYSAIRTMLELPEEVRFNLLNYSTKEDSKKDILKSEKKVFVKMPYFYEFTKIFHGTVGVLPSEEEQDFYNSIALILTEYKNDDSRTERFERIGIGGEQIAELLPMNASKYQHLSIKAMKKIMPYLLDGDTYDKACSKAGYDFKGEDNTRKLHVLKGKEITEYINDITNPVVKRSVSQAIKVLNAIILRYGSPMAVNIELSREMAKSFEERNQIQKDNETRFADNNKIKAELQAIGRKFPTGMDIVKYRLWQEQDGICPYSGRRIPYEKLFEPGFEIDHIIPYSISFDDGYRNKVLVYAEENQKKGNRTPYEYIGSDENRWSEFETRLNLCVRDYRKRQKLLKQHITSDERKEFKERNLNDTKYITRLVFNLIRQNLELAPIEDGKKKQVWAVNGAVTSYLRKRWGFPGKDRTTDKHHALDAIVIACCTDGMIRKISNYAQGRELRYARGFKFIDEETGEVIERSNFSRNQWDELFGVAIPKPWPLFTEEVEIRMSNNPREALLKDRIICKKIDYPFWIFNCKEEYGEDILRPIFVSRMSNHKVTGEANESTIRSPRHIEERMIVSKVPLTQLKLDKNTGEIVGYYNKESDRLLYEALKKRLYEFDGNSKQAFREEFRKPKSDGTLGPIVKKVKVQEKMNSGVAINGGHGFAKNGKMIRVDVFKRGGKYFLVPIYASDTTKEILPDKAVVAHKSEEHWRLMSNEDFIFSLYPNDLIYLESAKKIPLKGKNEKAEKESVLAYYTSMNINSAAIKGKTHDGSFEFENIGVQNLKRFEKRQVDLLGYITAVKNERRMEFR